MDELKSIISWFRVAAWGNQRKWAEFGRGFSRPDVSRGWKPVLDQRLQLNFRFYKANYIFIALICFAFTLLRNWTLLFAVLVVFSLYAYLFHVRRGPFVINGKLITERHQKLGWRIGAAIILFLAGALWPALKIGSFVAVVILAHSTFRTPTRLAESGSSKLHGYFDGGNGSDDEGMDEEAGGKSDGVGVDGDGSEVMMGGGGPSVNGGSMGGAGPLPGTVETRRRKNEEYEARRKQLAEKFPQLHAHNY